MLSSSSLRLGTVFLALVPTLALSAVLPRAADANADRPPAPPPPGNTYGSGFISESAAQKTNVSYDYVIIGGGTAGLTLAARLSANPALSVLVIEAGPSVKGNDLIDIPGFLGAPIGTPLDWVVNTVPQATSNGHVYNWPRGKMLGGSSALNFMVWNRASAEEANVWEALGNPGWNWNSLSS